MLLSQTMKSNPSLVKFRRELDISDIYKSYCAKWKANTIKKNDSHFLTVYINQTDLWSQTKHFGTWAIHLQGLYEQ